MTILEGVQQVQLVNQGIDWWNFWITISAVFIGAILAHLSAWILNKRQFKKNNELDYWNKVFNETKEFADQLKEYRIVCIKRIDEISEYNIDYAILKNTIISDSMTYINTQKNMEFLMYMIVGNEKHKDIYELYEKLNSNYLEESDKLYEVLLKLLNSKKNNNVKTMIDATIEFYEISNDIKRSCNITDEFIKKVIEKVKKYS